MPSERRSEKLGSLVQEEAARFVRGHAQVPAGSIATVTRVSMSADGKRANVFISLYPLDKMGAFKEQLQYLQAEFSHEMRTSLSMKYIPTMYFYFDEGEIKRKRIDQLLEGDR